MKVLVVGSSGLIGSTMFRVLSRGAGLEVQGTIRDPAVKRYFTAADADQLLISGDLESQDNLVDLFRQARPAVVVNCAGVTKHLPGADDPLRVLPMNALLPHRLARLCEVAGARLVHVSTDCVFAGTKGGYREEDLADAIDVYGRSKCLGEVVSPAAVTLRTSTIGHELQSSYGLLEWFLKQEGQCKGFAGAIFSGLPTVIFAQVVRDLVIARTDLSGLYHVAGAPIAKYDLLRLIAEQYGKDIVIEKDTGVQIDRSLNADRFAGATGFSPATWPEMIRVMHADSLERM